MVDAALQLLQNVVTSPWAVVVIAGFALLDAFVPLVPSEAVVITAGVYAASGDSSLVVIVVSAAVGAFIGDHLAYAIGRCTAPSLQRRWAIGSRPDRALAWARRTLKRRGGVVMVGARFIPGGRTATTLTMGASRYPRARFACWDAVAAVLWSIYATMLGFLGGTAFEEDPLKGLLLGAGLATGLIALTEAGRQLAGRLRHQSSVDESASSIGVADSPKVLV
ncbi:MAG: DedA family protein [Candidatus Nanopelagicales bacterium]